MTPKPDAALLRFDQVSAGYGSKCVLRDLNFRVEANDYLAVIGSNGGGKTTLLRTLLGILKPLSGRVERRAELRFGYVPQLGTVDETFPLSCFEIVLAGRTGRIGPGRRASNLDREHALEALRAVGIDEHAARLYRELSGGQKQRTLIARALANEPDLLVLDEHLSGLDLGAERAIMALLERLHTERELAIMMVSHSLNAVINHARRVGLLQNGGCAFLPVDEALRPETLREIYGFSPRVVEIEGLRVVV